MCVDLHIHSYYSDGTASPAQLVELASVAGLTAISLTDHDTVDGIAELTYHAKKRDLKIIPGLEVSATHREYCPHILGYGIDPENDSLRAWLDQLQQGRTERNRQIITKMQDLGLDVHIEEVEALSVCGQTGRPHIARLLLNKGIVGTVNDAFRNYLRKGASAWAGRFAYTAAQSIAAIHTAGGAAVLAHPGQLSPDLKCLPLFLRELVEYGLDGIEVYYPAHSARVEKRLMELAVKYKLVMTGGSDYHGDNKAHTKMASRKNGFCPPDGILEQLNEKISAFHIRIP